VIEPPQHLVESWITEEADQESQTLIRPNTAVVEKNGADNGKVEDYRLKKKVHGGRNQSLQNFERHNKFVSISSSLISRKFKI
jgi:hypothetical protein